MKRSVRQTAGVIVAALVLGLGAPAHLVKVRDGAAAEEVAPVCEGDCDRGAGIDPNG